MNLSRYNIVSKDNKPDLLIKKGMKFKRSGDIYILANTGNDVLTLIDISSGGRWRDGVCVDNKQSITKSEAFAIFGDLSNWEVLES